MKKRVASAILACGIAALASCSREARVYSTWASLGQPPPRTRPIAAESVPPAMIRPWAGTVSHHSLAEAQIDGWFSLLAARRKVATFYIVCPSHWGLSTEDYSITDGSWRIAGRLVASDIQKSRSLARALGVELEPTVFDPEHGIAALMPALARHFPHARVVAVACRGEPPLDQPLAQRLYRALEPAFDDAGRQRDFLVISTDFSHHSDRAATDARDARSRLFFASPSESSWILAGCDNRPGMYLLAKLLPPGSAASILFHCDSYELSGEGPDDITSYFFSYFW
jgi:MEMO1 family protein